VARPRRGEALAVEARDQRGDGVARPAAGSAGGLLVVGALGDERQHLGAGDLGGSGGLRPAHLGQGIALEVAERAERVFLAAGHLSSPGGTACCASDLDYGHAQTK